MLLARSVKRKHLLFILATEGGDAHAAYSIVKRLRGAYSNGELTLMVHSVCASAGTLITIGADALVLADSAELGPLDVQLVKPDDLIAKMSGLTPTKALETLNHQAYACFESMFLRLLRGSGFRITLKTAAEIATRLATGLYEPIYGQIDPFRLGEVARDNAIAQEYGERLDNGNLKPGALERLIEGYPVHEFVIDREEAAQHLFHEVRAPSEIENELLTMLEPLLDGALFDDKIAIEYLCEEPKGADNDSNHAKPAAGASGDGKKDSVAPGLGSSGEASSES
ncbi:MAG TPA: hypothetical protein VFG04_02705 [Planctomycetaceae bacterium]|nr:hypothetical protein [Planctomycetaceae bacterium]